jgi:hypothetical protein
MLILFHGVVMSHKIEIQHSGFKIRRFRLRFSLHAKAETPGDTLIQFSIAALASVTGLSAFRLSFAINPTGTDFYSFKDFGLFTD